MSSEPQPPQGIWYEVDEALDLLAALEDASMSLAASNHLAGVLELESQVRLLSRRLGFDDPRGGDDER